MSDLHVAIIMDGNGRWATARGLPRIAGHREGARTLRRIVEVAPTLGVGTLTVYAFSADNWRRPAEEVAWLMRLFRAYLRAERRNCVSHGIRVSVVGRRDRLPPELIPEIEATERVTGSCGRLWLRVAVDYSARDAILRAAQLAGKGVTDRDAFGDLVASVDRSPPAPAVDLVIRSGGERRLSDFMLWESAYAELHFSSRAWPDFGPEDLAGALDDFYGRERRFGGLRAASPRAGAA